MRLIAAALLPAALALVACTPDAPSPAEREPAPQTRHGELRDAIQAPQDRARAAGEAVQDAAEAQRRRIEEAGG